MTSKLKTDVLETVSGSGTIALTNQLSGMTSASVPQLTAAQMPVGSVIQLTSDTSSQAVSTTSGSLVEYTGCSVSITPTSTSSKILVQMAFNANFQGSPSGFRSVIYRNNTAITTTQGGTYDTNSGNSHTDLVRIALDAPSSTSAVTYKLYFFSHNGGLVQIYGPWGGVLMTAMEIKG
jgi:hypothetical protein